MRSFFSRWASKVLLAATWVLLGDITARGGEPLGPAWAAAAHPRVTVPSADEISAARRATETTLAELRAHLEKVPEGAMLEEQLRLPELEAQLASANPDRTALQAIQRALRVKRPGGLAEKLARLRAALEGWAGLATLGDAWEANAHEQLDRISAWDGQIGGDAELDFRRSYEAIAASQKLNALLPSIRDAHEHPNQQVWVNAAYLQTIAARSFTVPIQERQRRDGATITATGALPLRTRLVLLEDPEHATLRLVVEGCAPIALGACRGKIFAAATSQVSVDARQDHRLVATGVEYDEPELDLNSRTHLTNVNVNTRIGSRVAERVVSKVASRRLPDADRQAMRAAEPKIAARVNEECADIAYRINTLFRGLYLAPFAAEDVGPRVAFRSMPSGITWDATYARHDQLGALRAPPPPRVPSRELSYVLSLHESAVNHLADQLSGAWIDEATYWMLLIEEFKLRAEELDALPRGRLATALQFADEAPLDVRLDDGAITITLRLQAWRLEAEEHAGLTTVRARYALRPSSAGLQLVRDGEIAIDPPVDASLSETLQRYLPPQLLPRERFENAGVSQRLTLRDLLVDDGWLVIAAGMETEGAK